MMASSLGRRNLWLHPPPVVRRYLRVVAVATGVFGIMVLVVTAMLGYLIVRLGQLGPYAEQVLEKLIPMISLGLICEVVLFGVAAYLLAAYLAYKMAGPFVRLERELDVSLKQSVIRPLRVRRGDAMEGFIQKINQLVEAVSKNKMRLSD